MKSIDIAAAAIGGSRTPHGVRGLKCNEASPEYQRRMVAPLTGCVD